MEKHITLVGILNIVYRAILMIMAVFLGVLGTWFGHFIEAFAWRGYYRLHDFPPEVSNLVTVILLVIATMMFFVSIVGIIGAIGVLRKKHWGRIVLLIISFLNLLHVPVGTALGAYTIWVLMNDEIIKSFDAAGIAAKSAA